MKRKWIWGLFLMLALPCLAAMISTQQEIQIGQRAASQFEQQYGLAPDPAMQQRVQRIGQSLAAHSGRNDVRYFFKVANMEPFNALAFPGGYIYTTKGLMRALTDEELAFVLGHEIAHVARRHSVNQLEKATYTQVGLAAVLAALGNGRVQQNQATLARLASAVAGSQWSQNDERDADEVGLQIMARAGYDPVYAVSALDKLSRQSGGTPGFLNTLVGSHPLPKDRIRDAVAQVPDIPYQVQVANAPPARPQPSAPVPQFQAEVDKDWQQDLFSSLRDADIGLRPDPALMNRARELALGRVDDFRGAEEGFSFEIPAPAASAQAESILLGQRLPRLLREPRFRFYGLSVALHQQGVRRVVMILK